MRAGTPTACEAAKVASQVTKLSRAREAWISLASLARGPAVASQLAASWHAEYATIALLACLVAATAKFFMCVRRCFVSVDGLCPEEGFKGVWVSRSIVVVVLVGL